MVLNFILYMYMFVVKYLCSVYKEVWFVMIVKFEYDVEVFWYCCYVYFVFIVVVYFGY